MYLIYCVDDKGGLAFAGRRQSRDRAVRADLLAMAAGRPLWMSPASRRQFTEPEAAERIIADAAFLSKAAAGALCFVEDQPARPWLEKTEGFILYHWNRVYPADLSLDVQPLSEGFRLVETRDFPGYSHEKITKEVYVR